MSKLNIVTFSILLFIHVAFGENLNAEPLIKDRSEILGTWMLEYSTIRKGGEKVPESGKWEFGDDGILSITNYYSFADQYKTLTEKYEIKDGKIVAERTGTFEVLEKQNDKMVLKGPFGYYYFNKEINRPPN